MKGRREAEKADAQVLEILSLEEQFARRVLELCKLLPQIRDNKYYKDLGFKSFSGYLQARFHKKRAQSYTIANVILWLPDAAVAGLLKHEIKVKNLTTLVSIAKQLGRKAILPEHIEKAQELANHEFVEYLSSICKLPINTLQIGGFVAPKEEAEMIYKVRNEVRERYKQNTVSGMMVMIFKLAQQQLAELERMDPAA